MKPIGSLIDLCRSFFFFNFLIELASQSVSPSVTPLPISTNSFTMQRLPSELQCITFSYLNITDVHSFELACRAYSNMVTSFRWMDLEVQLGDSILVKSLSQQTSRPYPSFAKLERDIKKNHLHMRKLRIVTTMGFLASRFANLVKVVYSEAPDLTLAFSLSGMDDKVLKELWKADLVPPRDTRYTVELIGSLNGRYLTFIHLLLPIKRLWSDEGNHGLPTLADVDVIEERIWPEIHARICIHESLRPHLLASPGPGLSESLPFVYRKAFADLRLTVRSFTEFQTLQQLLPDCDNLQYLCVWFYNHWVKRVNGSYVLDLPNSNSVKTLAVYMKPGVKIPVVLRCDGELDKMQLDFKNFYDRMEFRIQSIGTVELSNCRKKVKEKIRSLITLRAQNVEMDTRDVELLGIFQPAAHSVMR